MMPKDDANVFKRAADEKHCIIYVRPSNPDSMLFAGVSGFTSKPLSCKAKTANNRQHPLSGLVVNPYMVKTAFLPDRLAGARKEWDDFQNTKLRDPKSGYAVDQEGVYRGCVTLNGKYLYSDYDLLAVIPVDANGNHIANHPQSEPRATPTPSGDIDYLSPLVKEVRDWINKNSGRPDDQPMVQHGADFEGPYRPESGEMLDLFAPGGIHRTNVRYMAPPINPHAPKDKQGKPQATFH